MADHVNIEAKESAVNKLKMTVAGLIILMIMTGCGSHYNVTGRVVDAQTKEPIEGAAVIIYWVGVKSEAIIAPYASGEYTLEIAEDVTDKDGKFTIPKYPLADHYILGVYKDGYICWDQQFEFLQHSDAKYKFVKRSGFRLGSFMKIKLEPYTDKTNEFEHASYIEGVCRDTNCDKAKDKIFSKAIKAQMILYHQYRNKMREGVRKKGK